MVCLLRVLPSHLNLTHVLYVSFRVFVSCYKLEFCCCFLLWSLLICFLSYKSEVSMVSCSHRSSLGELPKAI